MKAIRGYLVSAGVLLMLTALAKCISASGTSRMLLQPDPVVALSYGRVFWITGIFEFGIAITCLISSRHPAIAAGMVALLSTNLVLYRLTYAWLGHHKPCSCLGTLTGLLHTAPQTADMGMKIILAYLLVGSYGILIHQWWNRRADGGTQNDEIGPLARNSEIQAGS